MFICSCCLEPVQFMTCSVQEREQINQDPNIEIKLCTPSLHGINMKCFKRKRDIAHMDTISLKKQKLS